MNSVAADILRFGFDGVFDGIQCYSLARAFDTEVVEFVCAFQLQTVPIDLNRDFVTHEDADGTADVGATLVSLNLVNADAASYEQILEFRKDKESQLKLRRLRLFAEQNYEGKSKQFIEDDILVRLDDYEHTAKKSGFETRCASLTTLLSSTVVQGGLAGSLVAASFHEPLTAVLAAAGSVTIELGLVGIEVSKQRFTLREALRENPVSYISEAKRKLSSGASG